MGNGNKIQIINNQALQSLIIITLNI